MARRRTPPPATVSPAALKLIEQVQAEACAALLEELSAKDGITVLHPMERESGWWSITSGGSHLEYRDRAGSRVEYYRRFEEPDQWRNTPHMRGHWHPAYWNVYISRVDTCGTRWDSSPGRHVMDDFGALVCVEHVAP